MFKRRPEKLAQLFAVASLLVALHAFAGTWTELGPKFAGRASSVVEDASGNVYVSSAGGGIWKSTNGGQLFSGPLANGLDDFAVVHLEIDPNDPSRMYARTYGGVFVSTDAGAHWTRTLSSMNATHNPWPSRVCSSWPQCSPVGYPKPEEPGPWAQQAVSPTQTLIVTSLPCQGLQFSVNSGATFQQLWPFPGPTADRDLDNCITSVAIDGMTHKVWFTTMQSDWAVNGGLPHVWRSSAAWTSAGPPAGVTWESVGDGFFWLAHEIVGIAWGGASPDNMISLVNVNGNFDAYIYDGTQWNQRIISSGAGCVMYDARALVSGGSGTDYYVGGVTFAHTKDSGLNWKCPPLVLQYVDIRSIYLNPTAGRLWISGDQNALGQNSLLTRYNWSPGTAPSNPTNVVGFGIATWQAYSVAQGGSHVPKRLLIAAQDVNVACNDSGAVTWKNTSVGETQSIVWSRSGTGTVAYAYGTLGTVFRADNADAGNGCDSALWTDISPADVLRRTPAYVGSHELAVDPTSEARVFVGSGSQVLYSVDAGTNWTASDPGLQTSTGYPVGISSVFVDNNGALWIGTLDQGIYICSDITHYCDGSPGSGAWMPSGLNGGAGAGSPRYVTAIAMNDSVQWAATSQGIYRRLAGQGTWNLVHAGLPGTPFSDIAIDPSCSTRAYASRGYLDSSVRAPGGVDATTDEGGHWTELASGADIGFVPVSQILVDADAPQTIYASTYGRGVWSYTQQPQMCTPDDTLFRNGFD